ncbi:hypothetical protein [Spirilliplanes yamanashiensis]|uniref:Uncharacterized protein n=1 Tax=Spirilliplanes yamanashiensis TaxID=42233 RepID=A0A8J3YD77_9ACTN|nr:hypothetical protein [Spirilliplanes yamanashiensis]MDP9819136.1 hypothetical protein [Spirilliplanes yamanashiensis]GIJ05590.1 hypothetical protein Sya03_49420 [Spirilliplanes yamanashiensis]
MTPLAAVKRELLIRRLESWAGGALRARRATFALGYADDPATVQAAAAALAELTESARGRQLTMLTVGHAPVPPGVLRVDGETDERLAVALKAAGAAAAPVFGCLDAGAAATPPALDTVAALRAGKPAEALVFLAPDALAAGGDRLYGDDRWRAAASLPGAHGRAALVEAYRSALDAIGFPLAAAVELVAGDEAQLAVFATTSGKSLEAFKDALWAVDEFAGVRYRDPGDPDGHLIDISLNPHPGPLRRELVAHLEQAGERTVTQLRTFALTDTVYRAADVTRVLSTLVTSGAVRRDPEHGRLGGDVVISVG